MKSRRERFGKWAAGSEGLVELGSGRLRKEAYVKGWIGVTKRGLKGASTRKWRFFAVTLFVVME